MRYSNKNIKVFAFGILVCIFAVFSSSKVKAATPVIESNIVEKDAKIQSVEKNYSKAKIQGLADSLPSKYGSIDDSILSPVRNQSPFGACWAHSIIANAETSARKKGLCVNPDFSEKHLAYFTYCGKEILDPLGNLKGDYNVPKAGTPLQNGGDAEFCYTTMAKGMGLVEEKDNTAFEYPKWVTKAEADTYDATIDDKYAYQSDYKLKNAEFVSLTDVEIIKKKIMEYGIGSIAMYILEDKDVADAQNYKHLTSDKYMAYYQKIKYEETNHIVNVVGWDDDYPSTNFYSGCRPKNNGAWLIRNSWGTNDKFNGYMWVSYEEPSLRDVNFAEVDKSVEKENRYQYDGSCQKTDINLGESNGLEQCAIFRANGNGDLPELFKEVLVETSEPNIDYQVKIFRNDIDSSMDIDKFVDLAGISDRIHFNNQGFYTIPIQDLGGINPNELFMVQVTAMKNSEDIAHMRAARSIDAEFYEAVEHTEAGEGYIRMTDEDGNPKSDWIDMGRAPNNYSPCVKVITEDVVPPTAISGIEGDTIIDLKKGNKATLVANTIPEDADKTFIWESSDESIATVATYTGVVKAEKCGEVVISVMSGYNEDATNSVNVKIGKSYRLSFDANGGEGNIPYQDLLYGVDTIDLGFDTSSLKREGYILKGWSENKDDTVARYELSEKMTGLANMDATIDEKDEYVLYAVWEADAPEPTVAPTGVPTGIPTVAPTGVPTRIPTGVPTGIPTVAPTAKPTSAPTAKPTSAPTVKPTVAPTVKPTVAPTARPTAAPTKAPVTPSNITTNKCKKIKAVSKTISIKKKKSKWIVFNLTNQYPNLKTTDAIFFTTSKKKYIKISSKKLSLKRLSLKVKGLKKGKIKLTVKVGSRICKITVKVK